jgi:phage terminase large subunit GpA-like protein
MTGWMPCPHCDGRGWIRYEPRQPRQPEDFTEDEQAAMIASNVEHELREATWRELAGRELAAHPDETIPEIAVRVARIAGHGTSRARLGRVPGTSDGERGRRAGHDRARLDTRGPQARPPARGARWEGRLTCKSGEN